MPATNTPNFNLIKPGEEDFYNVNDQNVNMDTIDGVLKTLQDAINSGATEQELAEIRQELATHLAEKASLTKVGHVQLNSSTNSVSETVAATPKAVKAAMDRANEAFTSASNGKIVVRDSITGKGGTVADADGDGYPTFQELADGINEITIKHDIGDMNNISSPTTFGGGLNTFYTRNMYFKDGFKYAFQSRVDGNGIGTHTLDKFDKNGTLVSSTPINNSERCKPEKLVQIKEDNILMSTEWNGKANLSFYDYSGNLTRKAFIITVAGTHDRFGHGAYVEDKDQVIFIDSVKNYDNTYYRTAKIINSSGTVLQTFSTRFNEGIFTAMANVSKNVWIATSQHLYGGNIVSTAYVFRLNSDGTWLTESWEGYSTSLIPSVFNFFGY